MTYNYIAEDTEEEELVKEVLRDSKNFDKVFLKYKDVIRNFVRSRLSADNYTIDDVTSQIFYKAFISIKSFRWQGISIKAWLFRIARNTIIDQFRTNKDHLKSNIDDLQVTTKEKNPEEALIDQEFEDMLKTVLEALPDRERKIVYMKFFEGYSNKTIAKLTNISETNVGTILYRTMTRLRSLLPKA